MAYKEVLDLDCETTISLGGYNKKSRENNPTSIEGYLIGTKVVDSPKSKDGKAKLHIFQTAAGNVGVWGKTDLDRKMGSVTVGSMTKVEFVGMAPSKNGEMYKFRVAQDSDNTVDVSSIHAAAAQSDEEYVASSEDDDSSDEELDEAPVSKPTPPKSPLKTPSPERQAAIQAILNKNRK